MYIKINAYTSSQKKKKNKEKVHSISLAVLSLLMMAPITSGNLWELQNEAEPVISEEKL